MKPSTKLAALRSVLYTLTGVCIGLVIGRWNGNTETEQIIGLINGLTACAFVALCEVHLKRGG